MTAEEVQNLILAGIPDAKVDVKDLRGDGDHFEVRVESAFFQGKSRLDRHRMVFAAMQDRVGSSIQSFFLTTVVRE
jgi:stress-induced morphogen